RDATPGIAAGDGVARQPDDALDEVLLARLAHPDQVADRAAKLREEADIVVDLVLRRPVVGAPEHHDLAAPRLAQVINDLVYQHPVADEQLGLHRSRRDEERLHQERPHQHGKAERDDQQQRQLLPQRHVLALLPDPGTPRGPLVSIPLWLRPIPAATIVLTVVTARALVLRV